MKEAWKVIPDFERYEMNEDGTVKNRKTGRTMTPYLSHFAATLTLTDDKGTPRGITIDRLRWRLFGVPYLTASGRKNNGSLSDEDVRFIRKNAHAMSGAELARRYRVSSSMICRIKNGERRADVR